MDHNNYLGIDKTKRNTLRSLKGKKEKSRAYPISAADLLRIRRCPLCRSRRIVPITELYLESKFIFLGTGACADCLFVFRSVSPSLGWFEKCWRKIHTKKLEVFSEETEKLRRERYQEYHHNVSRFVRRGRVLDIGAGYGTGAELFQDLGFKVDTVEPEINKVQYIRKKLGIPVVARSIKRFVEQSRKNYDCILFTQCLEHVDYPKAILSGMKNLLNTDRGILYIEVPILWRYVNWSDALYLAHKSNFTEENLAWLVKRSGFEILDSFYANPDDRGKSWDWGIIARPDKTQGTSSARSKAFKGKRALDDIRKAYRKNWPLRNKPPLKQVIRYSVSHIEQFFQTLNLEKKRMVYPKSNSHYVSFESIK